MAQKIHKILGEWTRCGLHVKIHMKGEPSSVTTDGNKVTCKNCIRRSGEWIHAEELDYILGTMLGIFQSMAHQEDAGSFQKEHLGLKWKLGFEEAIFEFADRRSSKELMVASLIHAIKKIEENEDKKGG